MTLKDKIALGLVAIVIVVIVVVVLFMSRSNNTAPQSGVSALDTAATSPAPAPASDTRAPVSTGIVVPDRGASNMPANVAVPEMQAVLNATSNASYRSFSLTVANGAFTPNTVIVNVGDSVDLMITATGGNYDFTQPDYGFHVPLPAGKATKIDFGATAAGKFTFYCSSCGGPAKGPVGYIEVAP
jgi:heme/copper-type cytochrome/quinol oxidase subunit 2